MPVYEYRCDDCGNMFSMKLSMSEHGKQDPACPDCKGRNVFPHFSSFFAKTSRKS
ncbi:MAG: FmdB family zinc ribbon protein [Desulfuromonadaceae bacterium]